MPGTADTLTIAQARRISLAAQGFGRPRETDATWARVRSAIDTMGVVQIDSVSALVRSHYLPAFSRVGSYPLRALEEHAWGPVRKRALFEYWAHAASLLPVHMHRLVRWRMSHAKAGRSTYNSVARIAREHPKYVRTVLRQIEDRGPVSARDLDDPGKAAGSWWGWSSGKQALEYLFWAGEVTTATRRGFERVYDLPERVLPREVLDAPTPTEPEAHRELVRLASRSLGVATEKDLADYYRIKVHQAARAARELVEAGELTEVRVEGWKQRAYLARGARTPRAVDACALVSPFDPLVWERGRAERLFGLRYRIEIYTPEHKREFGYYVLPFVLGEAIAARVDLRRDGARGILHAHAAHLQPGHTAGEVAGPLAAELVRMARWLGLGEVRVARQGKLGTALAGEIKKA